MAVILDLLLNSIKYDTKAWIYSLILGGLTYYIVKFYYNVKRYPSGPIPLPIIGTVYSNLI